MNFLHTSKMMMKNRLRKISLILLACMLLGCLWGCGGGADDSTTGQTTTEAAGVTDPIDYAASVKLDMNSSTAKLEVESVKMYIDGDTTHFYVPSGKFDGGVLKARYLAVNTPESTGKIEEYGKTAAAFTKEKLSQATSIVLESDSSTWEADSTGSRYLTWVWYKTSDSDEYRNLNIEILQNGLAIASNSANNRYGSTCVAAINQAKAQKLYVHSGQKDPNFYYGEAVELTLKELRTNIETYSGIKVAFNGVITMNNNQTVYVEDYDPETDMYYGMAIYYGYNLTGAGLDILAVGNEVRIVGSVQYYEAGGTYQVSDLSYRQMKPDDPNNIQKISENNAPAYVLTDANTFQNGTVEITSEEGTAVFDYAKLAMNTSIEMKNLQVKSIYTTTNDDSSSKGAMTLTCEVNGITVSVRTTVLLDENKELITASAFEGKTIDVKGLVDYFDGSYQIKVFSMDNITIH